MNKSCRICLTKVGTKLFYMLDEKIWQKFKEVTQIELEMTEDLPGLMCTNCCDKLDEAHQYRSSLIEKESRLKLMFEFNMKQLNIDQTADEKEGVKQEQPPKPQMAESEKENPYTLEEDQEDPAQEDTLLEEEDQEEEPHLQQTEMLEEFIESSDNECEIVEEPIKHENEIKTEENDAEEMEQEQQEVIEEQEEIYEEYEEQFEAIYGDDSVFSNPEEKAAEVKDMHLYRAIKKPRSNIPQSSKIFKCWIKTCESRFPHRISLKRHMSTAHGLFVSKSSCLICGENFNTYVDFLSHTKTHRKFNCIFCNSAFSKSDALDNHLEKYHSENDSKDRPFSCSECKANFKRKEHLKSHVAYKHNMERKFKCLECPLSFMIRQDLKTHSRTHTGEKPFKCARCELTFKDLKSLKRHNIVVHQTRRFYVCEICNMDFELFKEYSTHKKDCGNVVCKTLIVNDDTILAVSDQLAEGELELADGEEEVAYFAEIE